MITERWGTDLALLITSGEGLVSHVDLNGLRPLQLFMSVLVYPSRPGGPSCGVCLQLLLEHGGLQKNRRGT